MTDFFVLICIYIKNIIMKRIIVEESEKERILNMHKTAVQKEYLTEQAKIVGVDPQAANASKFFASQWKAKVVGPQYGTPNLIYLVKKSDNQEQAAKYMISVYKAVGTKVGPNFSFIMPLLMGMLDWFPAKGFLNDENLQPQSDWEQEPVKTTQEVATAINNAWNVFTPEIVTSHLLPRIPKLGSWVTNIKSAKNFTELGPLLSGNAKSVYDLISKS